MFLNAIWAQVRLQNQSRFMCRYSDVDRSTSVITELILCYDLDLYFVTI